MRVKRVNESKEYRNTPYELKVYEGLYKILLEEGKEFQEDIYGIIDSIYDENEYHIFNTLQYCEGKEWRPQFCAEKINYELY